jgi:hypothetical protein
LNTASSFQNGDGVTIWNCGATTALATPNAPTITSGYSETMMVPDAKIDAVAGTTTYSYRLVALGKYGDISLPGTPTTLTTATDTALGLASVRLTVASESLTGNTLTVVMAAPETLIVNQLVHIMGSTNAMLSGWFNISSITNSTTFVINNIPIEPQMRGTTISSTGGTLAFAVGNRLDVSYSTGAWKYAVCAQRPGDSGYSVIGLTLPYSDVSTNAGWDKFVDWGATITSKPDLPAYITNSICTAGAATNRYLTTTIVSGAGSYTLTLANAASQNATGTAKFDNAPAFLAAAVGGGMSNLVVPPDPAGSFVINSFLDLSTQTTNVLQQGGITANETIVFPLQWIGILNAGGGPAAAGEKAPPAIYCPTAWPCVITPPAAGWIDSIAVVGYGNQSLQILWDADNNGSGTMKNTAVGVTDGSVDYSGSGLLIRAGAWLFDVDGLDINRRSQAFTDKSWAPAIYLNYRTSGGIGSVGGPHTFNRVHGNASTFYQLCYGSQCGAGKYSDFYIQGAITPTIVLQNLNGGTDWHGVLSSIANDTSAEQKLAVLRSAFGDITADITWYGAGSGSNETSGTLPTFITGTAPIHMTLLNDGQPEPDYPLTYVNTDRFKAVSIYAHDASDTGASFANSFPPRAIAQFYGPITTQSGSYIPLATPVMNTPVVSAGGSAHTASPVCYSVAAVGWSGGWSATSKQCATITAGNQTVALSWNPVAGAKGYTIYEDWGGKGCVGGTCTAITTTGTSYTISTPTTGNGGQAMGASAAPAVGFTREGLVGPQVLVTGPAGASGVQQTAACEAGTGITTLSTSGATTNTGVNCLPANAVIDSVVYYITTSFGTAASFTIGDATIATRFCGTQSTVTAGTSGVCFAQADQTGTSGPRQPTAAAIRITSNTTPSAGAIRLIVYYHTWTAPGA